MRIVAAGTTLESLSGTPLRKEGWMAFVRIGNRPPQIRGLHNVGICRDNSFTGNIRHNPLLFDVSKNEAMLAGISIGLIRNFDTG
jgi:hypothetical protein